LGEYGDLFGEKDCAGFAEDELFGRLGLGMLLSGGEGTSEDLGKRISRSDLRLLLILLD